MELLYKSPNIEMKIEESPTPKSPAPISPAPKSPKGDFIEKDFISYEYKPRADHVDNSPKVIGSASQLFYKELRLRAEEMRENPTEAEKTLWNVINNKKLGFKFRQQHIINRFIVDFYCIEKSLAIELDGSIHDKQQEHDAERDNLLNSLGVNILRFSNECIINKLDSVINLIIEKAEAAGTKSPASKSPAPKSPKGDFIEKDL